jgi:hypothetical protein
MTPLGVWAGDSVARTRSDTDVYEAFRMRDAGDFA